MPANTQSFEKAKNPATRGLKSIRSRPGSRKENKSNKKLVEKGEYLGVRGGQPQGAERERENEGKRWQRRLGFLLEPGPSMDAPGLVISNSIFILAPHHERARAWLVESRPSTACKSQRFKRDREAVNGQLKRLISYFIWTAAIEGAMISGLRDN